MKVPVSTVRHTSMGMSRADTCALSVDGLICCYQASQLQRTIVLVCVRTLLNAELGWHHLRIMDIAADTQQIPSSEASMQSLKTALCLFAYAYVFKRASLIPCMCTAMMQKHAADSLECSCA